MIYLTTKISFLLNPILRMIHILLLPVLISGFFYYALRPIVDYFSDRKVIRSVAILFVYFVAAALISLLGIVIWPLLQDQVTTLMNNLPQLIEGFRNQIDQIQQNRFLSMFGSSQSDWSNRLSGYLDNGVKTAADYISQSLLAFTNFVVIAATVPIIVYYMLKEGAKLPLKLLPFIPKKYRADCKSMLSEMDNALSGYILGRVIVTSILTAMLYIGFLLIHLPYSLLLAVISFVFNLIPYIGQFLGAIPCLIVAFIVSPAKALWVAGIIVVIQNVEGNLIAPHVYGKRLDIHPLTAVLLLLIGGDILGIVGILAVIPIYMILKIFVRHLYQLFLEKKVEELVE
ncbi:AI-2E family transporter [Cohnella pontilimi]|uniref:AI-2E family transporter n=2 Tax=Cohnella pontilimi TaxID=2564100 RepID=A0A4V6WEJ5_9BACL|nr:AI-2E family transporter [Cohnella pontilimi]